MNVFCSPVKIDFNLESTNRNVSQSLSGKLDSISYDFSLKVGQNENTIYIFFMFLFSHFAGLKSLFQHSSNGLLKTLTSRYWSLAQSSV